jgi:protein-S-isoprenylcysteine O-methyltransferase Ste14
MRAGSEAGPVGRALAWIGGGAFIASLAVFVWSYAVPFGTTSTAWSFSVASTVWPAAVDLALFSAFALHHSIMARPSAKHWLMTHIPAALERTLYVWISSVLFALTCLLWQEIPAEVYSFTATGRAVALLIQLTGVGIIVRAAGVIDPLDLAGIRQATGTERPARFQVIGPYRVVRHPIYLGWMLVTFGAPTMTATRLWFAIVSSAYLALAIPFEERSLLAAFGAEYRAYQARVRSRLIPRVW